MTDIQFDKKGVNEYISLMLQMCSIFSLKENIVYLIVIFTQFLNLFGQHCYSFLVSFASL